jgi:protein MpaA
VIVGQSVGGRPIEATIFGDGATLALVHGGIHGDEPGAVEVVRRLVALAPNWAGRRVVAIPAVNPDGLVAGTKDNARGVDLNRNFPSRNWSKEHPPGYFPGTQPLSEPESAALSEVIERERPARIVAVHQPFRCVNFDGPARALAEQMSEQCGWPVRESVGYPTPGSFGSLYGVDRGLPVITLELPRPATDEDLMAGLRAILAVCR